MLNKEKIRPKVGLGVFIFDDDRKVLLMKRRGSSGAGTWCPPGGHLEMEESFLECAKKEVKEEVNLEIEDINILGITNDISSSNIHYVTIQTKAIKWKGEPKNMEPEKCSEIGWFSLNGMPSPLFLPLENAIKQDFLNNEK